jgi:hypothetical protein
MCSVKLLNENEQIDAESFKEKESFRFSCWYLSENASETFRTYFLFNQKFNALTGDVGNPRRS